jgi:hypothetical protein
MPPTPQPGPPLHTTRLLAFFLLDSRYCNDSETRQHQGKHLERAHELHGVEGEAERCTCAPVNEMSGGGQKHGSGRGQQVNRAPAKKGGHLCGRIALIHGVLRLPETGGPDPHAQGSSSEEEMADRRTDDL